MKRWLLGIGLLAVTAGAESFAQEPGGFDTMVVTATRTETDLATLAGNTALLDGEEITFIRADHIAEALNRLPGVYIHANSGQDHLTAIRSPVLTGGAGAGSFLFLENGVPLRAAGFANVNGLFESVHELASSIEVVRGPGSALYGSNAVHGLINVILPDPVDGFEAVADVSAGSFDRYRGRAWVSGTAGAHGFYAGLSLLNDGGWRDDTETDQQKVFLRWDFEQGALSIRTTLAANNLNQESAGFVQGEDAYKNSALSRLNPTPNGFRDAQAVRFSSRIDWERSESLTLSFTPFARWTDLTFPQTFLPSQALEENGHKSVGLLSSAYWSFDGGHQIIIGADVEVTDGFLREEQFLPDIFSFTQGVHYDYDILATVLAGYARGTWAATPRLEITGGLRLEYTEYEYETNTPADTVGRFQRVPDRTDTYFTATPEIAAFYALTDEAGVYARYARGARAPQTTDVYRLQINQEVGDVEEEVLDSIEVGFRGLFWRGAAVEVAAFFAEKRNFFFRDTDGFNVPDGRTRHVGVELDAVVPVLDTLTFALSGTYARHTYRFDNTVSANSTETIRFGDDVDTAPRLLANARVVWTPVDGLIGEAEWVYVGDYFLDASNSRTYPGHQLVNLRTNWAVTDHVDLFATVRNLLNTDYANRADFSFGNERYFPGEDRAYSGGVRVRF